MFLAATLFGWTEDLVICLWKLGRKEHISCIDCRASSRLKFRGGAKGNPPFPFSFLFLFLTFLCPLPSFPPSPSSLHFLLAFCLCPLTAKGLGERYSSLSGSGQSPTTKRNLVQFTVQNFQICLSFADVHKTPIQYFTIFFFLECKFCPRCKLLQWVQALSGCRYQLH